MKKNFNLQLNRVVNWNFGAGHVKDPFQSVQQKKRRMQSFANSTLSTFFFFSNPYKILHSMQKKGRNAVFCELFSFFYFFSSVYLFFIFFGVKISIYYYYFFFFGYFFKHALCQNGYLNMISKIKAIDKSMIVSLNKRTNRPKKWK